jgi:hypothetical protein
VSIQLYTSLARTLNGPAWPACEVCHESRDNVRRTPGTGSLPIAPGQDYEMVPRVDCLLGLWDSHFKFDSLSLCATTMLRLYADSQRFRSKMGIATGTLVRGLMISGAPCCYDSNLITPLKW